MGAATSYQSPLHTDKYLFQLTTQNIGITGFAVDADPTSLEVVEVKDSLLANWTYVTTANNVIIFYTTDGTTRTIGTGDTQEYVGFTDQAFTSGNAPFNVYWSNVDTIGNGGIDLDAADASSVFSSNSNNFLLASESGSGSGDPRISPYVNPYRQPLILPVNTKTYNYLAYHSDTETIIINAKMWSLSGDRIVFTEEIRRDLTIKNGRYHTENKKNVFEKALENITKYPLNDNEIGENDVSFIKELYITHKTPYSTPVEVFVDMETLDVKGTIEHPNIHISNKNQFTAPQIDNKNVIKFTRDNTNSYIRTLTIKTEIFDNLTLDLVRDTNRLNHRNSMYLRFLKNANSKRIEYLGIKGCLMHYDRIYTVPSLTTTNFQEFIKEPIPELVSDYKNRNAKRLKERRFQIRKMVREHDFHLLEPSNHSLSQ